MGWPARGGPDGLAAMQIRELDVNDDVSFDRWYAALRAGAAHGRVAPLVESAAALRQSLRSNPDNPDNDRRAYGAWDGETCAGTAQVRLPRQENQHLAEVSVCVPPDHRGGGVGAALCDHLLAVAREQGRSTFSEEIDVPEGSTLRESPGGRFALARGFESKHTEQRLVLPLPVPADHLDRLESRARESAGDARVVTWHGVPPREWLEAFARMQTLMEQDVPTGELDRAPMMFDAERVLAGQQRNVDQGYELVTTLALAASGEPTAYTMLFVTDQGEAMQDDTFVLRAHRGRRLGTLVKVANLRALAERFPEVRHVHTWTDGTNDAMWVTNAAFGFRSVETMHEVELTVT